MTKRNRRDPYSRTVVLLPERELTEAILDLASPLLQPLGPTPAPDEARRVIGVAITLWNAHVRASQLWGDPRPKPLADLRKAMCGKQSPPDLAATFERLSARWKKGWSSPKSAAPAAAGTTTSPSSSSGPRMPRPARDQARATPSTASAG